MGLHDFTFYDLVCRNGVSFGNLPAWQDSDSGYRITFAQFKGLVDRLACGLQERGIQKGDRIGVLAKNSLEYFTLFGAAAGLGAIVLPINWRLSPEEVRYNLNDGSPRLLFADNDYFDMLAAMKEGLPSVEEIFSLQERGSFSPGFGLLLQNEGRFKRAEVSDRDGLVIIHTAAVGGNPRGALLSHENVLCADMHFCFYLGLTPDDVLLGLLPLYHVGGLFMATAGFHAGAKNVNLSRFDAPKAADLIQEEKISFLMEFPPVLASILDQQEISGKDLGSLRIVTGIDSAETIERYERITGGTYWCLYGQTETSSLVTFGRYRDRPGAAGRMLPLVEARIEDEQGSPLPVGEVGEITVKGPMVFQGYWNLPKDTAHVFREGRHHTGDRGRIDQEGFLWYAGRKPEKELIKPGGENVYPAEVERVILQHPAIESTVVFGVPDPKWKEGIKAVCKLREGSSLTPQELIDFVGERIARFKKPHYVEWVREMPLQKDGSPDRFRVKQLYGGKAE